MVLQRIVKPKNQRVKRALEKRESKIHENDKITMFITGGRTCEVVTSLMKDLYNLKKPLAIMYQKKNLTRPFEDQTSMEFFGKKSDSSLFLFGSHSKKRPNNLVFGRLFDYHIMDMIEMGIEKYQPISDFPGDKCVVGTKPCLVFSGEAFDADEDHKRLKCLFTDFFRGPRVPVVRLAGLEHMYHFTAIDGQIQLRSYRIFLKKSGCRTPRIELEEIGPSVDLVIRRTHLASHDLYSKACKQPKAAKAKKKKNVSHDTFGTQHGRIHMQKQDIDKLQLRKMKGLKKRPIEESAVDQVTEPTAETKQTETPQRKRKRKHLGDE